MSSLMHPVRSGARAAGPVTKAQPAGTPVRRRRPDLPLWIGVVWIACLALVALLADVLPIAGYDEVVGSPMQSPHLTGELLGTDAIGRSVLSRILYGARASMAVGLTAAVVGLVVGGFLGLLAGYFRGLIEAAIDTLAEVVQAFPPLLFLIALAAALRPSLTSLTLSLAILIIPSFARMTKGSVVAQSSREFVLAARAMGASHWRIMFREILPNALMSIVAFSVVVMALLIVIEGSLSFLGFGMPMPYPSWGGMVAEGEDRIASRPSLVFVPVFFLFMTVYSLNTVGDHLRRRFDVEQSQL
jgi:peptide/nickel transport system permease protein